MKEFLKMVGLIIVGLLTAVIIYPVLHEGGHSLNAVLVGATVTDFTLFPLPCALCDVIGVSIPGRVFIGFGGVMLPIVVSVLANSKNFWIWYVGTIIKLISVLALGIASYACIQFKFGTPIINEDATQILEMWPDGWVALFVVCLVTIGYILLNVIKQRPIRRCCEYFEV